MGLVISFANPHKAKSDVMSMNGSRILPDTNGAFVLAIIRLS